jgi:hypothetical protein
VVGSAIIDVISESLASTRAISSVDVGASFLAVAAAVADASTEECNRAISAAYSSFHALELSDELRPFHLKFGRCIADVLEFLF